MNQENIQGVRVTLSFSVDGLSMREELLLKSFIRILSHRTHQIWIYSPLPYGELHGPKGDVQFITEDKLPGNMRAENMMAEAVLVIGHVNRRQPGFLCLPINHNELETELNRIGARIVSARSVEVASNPPAQPPQQNRPLHIAGADQAMQLLRWPPPGLLGSPVRLKLATLMTGKAMTLPGLQLRSGLSEQTCRDFLLDLQQAGLLSTLNMPGKATVQAQRPTGQQIEKPRIQAGLLSRIRNRLGLQAGTSA